MSSYDNPANVARYSGVQGSPNSRRPAHRNPPKRGGIRPEHVLGVRHVLRAHGYNVDATGPMTDRLLSAWRNYRRGIQYGTGRGRGTGDNAQPGALTVDEWKQRNPRGYGKQSGALHTITHSPPADSSAAKGIAPKHKVDPTVNAHAQAKAHVKARVHARNLGAPAPKGGKMPGADTSVLLSRGMADQIAGEQYDPQIREARLQQQRNAADEAQAQRDIGSWWDQVQGHQKEAQGQDAAAGSAARADQASLVQSLQGILGGSRGAGTLAASGAADAAALASQGQAQDSYNADIAPILAAQRASDQTRQQAVASQNAEKLQAQLVDLQGARGQAKTKALMDIISANNASRQQNFSNRLALSNAALAAESLGLDAQKTQAQLAQYGLDARYKQAQLKQQQKQANPHPDWHQLQLPDRNTVISAAVKAGLARLPAGAPWDPGAVRNAALAYLRNTGGFGSARKLSWKGKVPNRQNQVEILGALNQAIQNAGSSYNARP